jgi:small conductance mechanosensitive channel
MQDLAPQIDYLARTYLLPLGWKLIGAAAVWIVGGWVVRVIRLALGRFLNARHVDTTLVRYLDASANVLMKVLVLVAVLSVLGIETTSFAALLAAVGVAIGAAWAGLLSNFAAGIFLMVLRPFKVGDMITAGGTTGAVREIGLFATAMDTPDNVRVYVGNGKLFSDSIQNYTTNPYRRVDLTAQLAHGVDPQDAMVSLQERIARIPHVLPSPAPSIEILSFTPLGPVLAVRPFCHNDHYWSVYFAANRAIVEVCGEAGYPVPNAHYTLKSTSAVV